MQFKKIQPEYLMGKDNKIRCWLSFTKNEKFIGGHLK